MNNAEYKHNSCGYIVIILKDAKMKYSTGKTAKGTGINKNFVPSNFVAPSQD
jgi:hypothetical protein